MSITGNFFKRGGAALLNDDIEIIHPKDLSRQDLVRLAQDAAAQFMRTYGNLLSLFQLTGEYGLWTTLQTYMQDKGLSQAVLESVEDGDSREYVAGIFRDQEIAFHDLFVKGALVRLQLGEEIPEIAMDEWLLMQERVESRRQPVQVAVVAAPVVTLTPAEQCIIDFKGDKTKKIHPLSSDAFRNKWLNDRRNRPVYDSVVAQGLV